MARKRVEVGSDNVFRDPAHVDAKERRLKVQLAMEVNRVLTERSLTQSTAAELLGVRQPHVSELARHRLDRFSVERLLHFLTVLGDEIEIRIARRPPRRARSEVRVLRQEMPHYRAGARKPARAALELYSDKRATEFDSAERELKEVLRQEKPRVALLLPKLSVPKDKLAALCRRHGIRKLSLFGSASRNELRPDSDVDLMVEFGESGTTLLDFPQLKDELSALFGGRPVDLVPPEVMKNPFRRKAILRNLRVLYEA